MPLQFCSSPNTSPLRGCKRSYSIFSNCPSLFSLDDSRPSARARLVHIYWDQQKAFPDEQHLVFDENEFPDVTKPVVDIPTEWKHEQSILYVKEVTQRERWLITNQLLSLLLSQHPRTNHQYMRMIEMALRVESRSNQPIYLTEHTLCGVSGTLMTELAAQGLGQEITLALHEDAFRVVCNMLARSVFTLETSIYIFQHNIWGISTTCGWRYLEMLCVVLRNKTFLVNGSLMDTIKTFQLRQWNLIAVWLLMEECGYPIDWVSYYEYDRRALQIMIKMRAKEWKDIFLPQLIIHPFITETILNYLDPFKQRKQRLPFLPLPRHESNTFPIHSLRKLSGAFRFRSNLLWSDLHEAEKRKNVRMVEKTMRIIQNQSAESWSNKFHCMTSLK